MRQNEWSIVARDNETVYRLLLYKFLFYDVNMLNLRDLGDRRMPIFLTLCQAATCQLVSIDKYTPQNKPTTEFTKILLSSGTTAKFKSDTAGHNFHPATTRPKTSCINSQHSHSQILRVLTSPLHCHPSPNSILPRRDRKKGDKRGTIHHCAKCLIEYDFLGCVELIRLWHLIGAGHRSRELMFEVVLPLNVGWGGYQGEEREADDGDGVDCP